MEYALLLRGVNVGGARKVKMADFADMLTALGFTQVKTYLNSGNAVLRSTLEEAALCAAVSKAMERRFGFECDVIARTGTQLRQAKNSLPFSAEDIAAGEAANPDTAHLYIYFLPQPPEAAVLQALQTVGLDGDQLSFAGREIYLLCSDSVRTSKAAASIARRLPQATARNWNTLVNLLALLDSHADAGM